MAEIRPIHESTFRRQILNIDPLESPADLPEILCAYNQTGQRFISNEVVVPDSAGNLEDCLSNLSAGSAAAVWIVPIQTLPAFSFRFPVDLLYLDRSGAVVAAVQSFPLARVSPSANKPASILALPARSVLSGRIVEGDEVMVCSPEEMQRYLLEEPSSSEEVKPQLVSHNDAVLELRPLPGHLLGREKPVEKSPGSSQHQKSAPKSWWQKLLNEEPPDPRKADRSALPGLIAYFFTGGVPKGHPVRDISKTGLYVLTNERWYPGTIVRLTLTDESEPTAERSATLYAKAVRSTEDGMALQFVLHEKNDRLRGTISTLDNLSAGCSVRQVEEFINHYKSRY